MSELELAKLRTLVADINRAEQKKTAMVHRLRERGATWTEIGYALGITAQGAQKRYGTGTERDTVAKETAARRALKRRIKSAATRGVNPT